MGFLMTGKLRYFKEQNGHFYTRIAVPGPLQLILGKSQLQEALGSERRNAERLHHGVVVKLQTEIAMAKRHAAQAGIVEASSGQFPLSTEQIALSHYRRLVALDEAMRGMPGYANVGINDQRVHALRDGIAGAPSNTELSDTIGSQVERYRAAGNHNAKHGTPEWRAIARALCVAEYEALERAVERDEGDFAGQPKNPILSNIKISEPPLPPVSGLYFAQ